VTSGTKLADHKLPFKDMLRAIAHYASKSKGISALQFSIDLGFAYSTAFTLLHKLREGLWNERDLTPLSGTVHVDGSHFCGRPRRQNLHGGKYKKTMAPKGRIEDATTYHPNRRIAIVLRELYPTKGLGARRTIVEIAQGENAAVANEVARRYIKPGSIVMTDEGTAFAEYGRKYAHRKVNHKLLYVKKDGTNNNQAESFWARAKRMWRSQLHRMTPHNLAEYVNECAWREDMRRRTQKEKAYDVLHKALHSGLSRWWLGYSQGTHRTGSLELTI
jgi:hypothetical protein